MTPDLTVSIVLYKTPINDIHQVIESLKFFKGKVQLFFVDNSPTDDLRVECRSILPFDYIHMPKNPGFGTGHNVAIKKAQEIGSNYHLVLNADVYFHKDIISPMLKYLDEHPNIGQIMPKVINEDGTVQRLCKLVPTPADLLLRRFFFRKAKNRSNSHFELHKSGYDKIMFVPYLSGCFMLLRQSALKEIGMFDERFFMYPEDIDLTRRMAVRYETIFFPKVSVVHKHDAASYKSLKMLFIHIINLILYFNKWGWFHDPIRSDLNTKTLIQFSKK
jgi:GT2 family glycosyltransferase